MHARGRAHTESRRACKFHSRNTCPRVCCQRACVSHMRLRTRAKERAAGRVRMCAHDTDSAGMHTRILPVSRCQAEKMKEAQRHCARTSTVCVVGRIIDEDVCQRFDACVCARTCVGLCVRMHAMRARVQRTHAGMHARVSRCCAYVCVCGMHLKETYVVVRLEEPRHDNARHVHLTVLLRHFVHPRRLRARTRGKPMRMWAYKCNCGDVEKGRHAERRPRDPATPSTSRYRNAQMAQQQQHWFL